MSDAESELPDRRRASPTLDQAAFAGLFAEHRRELHVHCYRMLGSFEDAEDLVQETFLRAWRKRDTFQGRSTFRVWLYRIATNACLDHLERRPRQPRWQAPAGTPDSDAASQSPDEIPWLQPYPDHLLEPVVARDAEPDAAVVEKETIELAFLVAIQHLPPRQRAVLILRDVLGWPASGTSDALGLSVASVNSAVQRARAALKRHLPPRRLEWAPSEDPTEAEQALLQRYVDAFEKADVRVMAELLHEDVRVTMPTPVPCAAAAEGPRWQNRDALVAGLERVLDPASPGYQGRWRSLPTRANRQPAVAHYVRRPGDDTYRAQVLEVLWVEDGKVAEITAFAAELFPAFGLPVDL